MCAGCRRSNAASRAERGSPGRRSATGQGWSLILPNNLAARGVRPETGWRCWRQSAARYRAKLEWAWSLRRLLSNILYTGGIRHKGQNYAGEHAAILAPGTWERVQALLTQCASVARGRARNKHLALLSGLLFCESCATPMVYSYSGNNQRKYPYYLCLNAQRKGWAVCPAKSLPARAIEESVLVRIREAQRGILDVSEWDKLDRARQVEALQMIVERVGYDGAARQISIRFHETASTAEEEVRA